MKFLNQAALSLEYFYQKLLKLNSVWPNYGWWKNGMFYFDSRCRYLITLIYHIQKKKTY